MSLLQRMSSELRLDPDFIMSTVNSTKKYRIYKKGSKFIYNSSGELKTLQYWLNSKIFSILEYSKFTAAYQKGCSIKKNASIHSKSNYILHTDIENFFNNITEYHINILLEEINQLGKSDKELIKKIILYKGHLVIGSVSAPHISNCVMYKFDIELYDTIINNTNMKYTRYADDITISSKEYITHDVIKKVEALLVKYKFSINNNKTYFSSRATRRRVTGITIDNSTNELSLGHKKYKFIKKEIYNFLVKEQGCKDKILGNLAFIKDINSKKYDELKSVYLKYDKEGIVFSKEEKDIELKDEHEISSY
ncbi:reverse transcriptase domain-containing protein [Clostridium cibarium]|uniref:RNA-directed DNA polymerase n=1 Tax=Clostridium cibarium TaxID=2762247 RepID=A0ABR8PUX9_9CLOT|nr:reverse transcriptase domain-containing protein [Clostridium cibarium]MBD7911976.1 RNA-directed DNA polymerase [Clostridium cibarium]